VGKVLGTGDKKGGGTKRMTKNKLITILYKLYDLCGDSNKGIDTFEGMRWLRNSKRFYPAYH
jgi:hypothetical protein